MSVPAKVMRPPASQVAGEVLVFRRLEGTSLKRAMSDSPGSTPFEAVIASEAQSRFVAENMRRVFLLIYRMVGNVADAQDLTQEAFIKALQRQDQLKDFEKANHWLSRIASNTAIDFLRRSGRMSFSELDEMPEFAAVSSLENPEQSFLRREKHERLEASLAVLTERERTALLLRDVEDMAADDVANQLGCSKATVRSHIANARVKLRKHFDKLGRKEGRSNDGSADDGRRS